MNRPACEPHAERRRPTINKTHGHPIAARHAAATRAPAAEDATRGVDISAAQWAKELGADKPSLGVVAGQSTTIVPNLMIRRCLDGPNNASVHTAEIDKTGRHRALLIVDGSGTCMTGGTIPDRQNRTAGIKGGEAHDVKAGDSVVIPPGTAHWFVKINVT